MKMFQGKTFDLVCIGSANMDVIARVDEFPGIDGQVPVTRLSRMFGGSAANTAVACSKLGMTTAFLGRVGSDTPGEELIEHFMSYGIDISGIIRDITLPSGQVFIAVNKAGQRMMFANPGAPQALCADDIEKNLELLSKSVMVHLASLKRPDPLDKVASIAPSAGFILSSNPGSILSSLGWEKIKGFLKHVDILTASRHEICSIFGDPKVENSVKTCFQETDAKIVAVTHGARGSSCYTRKFDVGIIPAFSVNVVDTTGAGDAFTAGFLYEIYREFKKWLDDQLQKGLVDAGVSPREVFGDFIESRDKMFLCNCARVGNAMGSFAVQCEGAQEKLPTADALEAFIKENAQG